MNLHQEDVMAYIIREELIPPTPADRFQPPYYIKHVKFREMEMVENLSYERLQNNLLTEYLISTHQAGPQVIDRLMTVSFKPAEYRDCSQEVLERGVALGGAMFRFLGHSNSQLKDKTCYLMAATDEEIHDLLAQFADFSKIPSIAKRAKRIGLLFSSFNKSLSLHEEEYEVIPDIKSSQYNFTDGCGFMSEGFAREIQGVHRLNHVPCVVQIRYQGYKGVLVISHKLTGLKVQFRESMKKFSIPDDEVRRNSSTFGVVEYSKPYSKAFLNTQLTMVLADNGTLPCYLLELQTNYFNMLTKVYDNEEEALRYLTITGRTRTIQCLKEKGLNDPQVQQELQGLRNEDIKKMLKDELETKICRGINVINQKKISKLRVLVPKARIVFGVCDPYGELEYGEVFFQPTLPDGEEVDDFSSTRRVIVGHNPCYHPGDIRVLKLVHNKRRYFHLYDCIVFPTKGRRPHPDECSGGDLDGDKFFVSWDEFLIPEWMTNPFPYHEKQEDPYCPVWKTLRNMFLPLSNIFGSFGRAHFERIFGTEDEATRRENIRQRTELLNYFANFNNKLVSRIDAIFMKYASRHGPSCETCVTLNKYFSDAIDMVANNDVIEKHLEGMENAYRKEKTAHEAKKGKEPVYPRLIYPSRRIMRRRVETPEGFLSQLRMDCRSTKKESYKEDDDVWTIMEKRSEEFVKTMLDK